MALICGTSTCHMVPTLVPTPVPGVWGPYLDAMLPGTWLLEAGQSAAGSALDHTLRCLPALKHLVAEAEAGAGPLTSVYVRVYGCGCMSPR